MNDIKNVSKSGCALSILAAIALAVSLCGTEAFAAEIEIDATALSASTFNIDFGASGGGPTNAIATLDLSPGVHLFAAPASGSKSFLFTVTNAGRIDLSGSGTDDYVTGQDSNRLTVSGLPMSVDATSLSAIDFSLDVGAAAVEPTSAIANLQLLPGDYIFQVPHGNPTTAFQFAFPKTGVVDYDTSLNSYVSGRGTDTLTVTGFAVTFDATALSAGAFNVNFGKAGSGSTDEPEELRLIPGDYVFHSPASHGSAKFPFEILSDGSFDFDSSLDAFLSGRFTEILGVLGYPITIDATALGDDVFLIDSGATGTGLASEVSLFVLLPGIYAFDSGFDFAFLVSGNGKVDYEAAFDDALFGRGSSYLLILDEPGNPPGVAELLDSLIAAVAATDSTIQTGMLAILEVIDPDDPSIIQLQAFIRLVENALSADQIDPVEGQLLIARADLLLQQITQ